MTTNWGELPEYIVAKVLQKLDYDDRLACSKVCSVWSRASEHPSVWSSMDFNIVKKEDEVPDYPDYLTVVEKFGSFIRNVNIQVNQSVSQNRKLACDVIDGLSRLENRKLSEIKLSFTGENPCLYSGIEFINALQSLFGLNPEVLSPSRSQLTVVDLSELSLAYDDRVISLLGENHAALEKLNVMNNTLVNNVTPTCMINLIKKCRKLKELHVCYSTMSDDALLALAEEDRSCLQNLSLSCKGNDRFTSPVTTEAWEQLTAKSPNLKVTLMFDDSIPLVNVSAIMRRGIPVYHLHMEKYSDLYRELMQATRYYWRTLETLVVRTLNYIRFAEDSEDLCRALVHVSRRCKHLKKLMVYSILNKTTVDKIYEFHPNLRSNGCSHLRYNTE